MKPENIKFKAKRLDGKGWVFGFWMGCEDILGNGWCYKKDCETSCDKVCKKHEF